MSSQQSWGRLKKGIEGKWGCQRANTKDNSTKARGTFAGKQRILRKKYESDWIV